VKVPPAQIAGVVVSVDGELFVRRVHAICRLERLDVTDRPKFVGIFRQAGKPTPLLTPPHFRPHFADFPAPKAGNRSNLQSFH